MSLYTLDEYRNHLKHETGLQFDVAVEEELGKEELVLSLQDLELFRMPPSRDMESLISSLPPRLSVASVTLEQRLQFLRELIQRCSLDELREVLRNFQLTLPERAPEQESPQSAMVLAEALYAFRLKLVQFVFSINDIAVQQRLQQYIDMDHKSS